MRLVAWGAVLWLTACGGEERVPEAAQPAEALVPVDVVWGNQLERCVHVSALGGEYLTDRWGTKHFVVGVETEEVQPVPSCCGPTEAIDYEARATVRFEGGSYVYSMARGAALRAADRKSLTLTLPAPMSGEGQTTSYDVKILCGPHD
jgi:hypothetical protein